MDLRRTLRKYPLLRFIRRKQRIFCFYMRMRLDANRYASIQLQEYLPHRLFEAQCPLLNFETGFDMVFQENKVFNLKLAAAVLDKVIIRPGETFSFWQLVHAATRSVPFKNGLTMIDGQLTTAPGGGLCQMSNSLFWTLLHTPLTIAERHGHAVKDFPEPPSDAIIGVDATVSEGWLDLKLKNETTATFQIGIAFDAKSIITQVYADRSDDCFYEVANRIPSYFRGNGKIIEETDVLRKKISVKNRIGISEEVLYRNHCEIAYPLPKGTNILKSRGYDI